MAAPGSAHRLAGQVSHVEIRGPDYKGSLTGGTKDPVPVRAEAGSSAPIGDRRGTDRRFSLFSLAVPEQHPAADTLLRRHPPAAWDPARSRHCRRSSPNSARSPDGVVASAADANTAGDRHTDHHAVLAGAAGVRFIRLRPPKGLDFNGVLRKGRGP